MRPDTETLLRRVADRVERAIRERDCPAIVALQGDRPLVMSDYDYLRDEATATAFEHRVAEKANEIHTRRFAFVVPQVWVFGEGVISGRSVSNHPLREGEQEVLAWITYDADDGVDYGYLPYTRRPGGEPVFGDHAVITAPVEPYDAYPGRMLLRALTEDPGGTALDHEL
ncbi:hypothetical protein ABT039_25575 [Streptomyces lasiicapitis]|uniref:hypothetical protein n=1 Tax=Streptomyces lasiicapitis TaxID=1923961 RepID=UPI003329E1B1